MTEGDGEKCSSPVAHHLVVTYSGGGNNTDRIEEGLRWPNRVVYLESVLQPNTFFMHVHASFLGRKRHYIMPDKPAHQGCFEVKIGRESEKEPPELKYIRKLSQNPVVSSGPALPNVMVGVREEFEKDKKLSAMYVLIDMDGKGDVSDDQMQTIYQNVIKDVLEGRSVEGGTRTALLYPSQMETVFSSQDDEKVRVAGMVHTTARITTGPSKVTSSVGGTMGSAVAALKTPKCGTARKSTGGLFHRKSKTLKCGTARKSTGGRALKLQSNVDSDARTAVDNLSDGVQSLVIATDPDTRSDSVVSASDEEASSVGKVETVDKGTSPTQRRGFGEVSKDTAGDTKQSEPAHKVENQPPKASNEATEAETPSTESAQVKKGSTQKSG